MALRDSLKAAKMFTEYKKQRNKVSDLVRKSKSDYFKALIDSNRDTASLWRAINEVTDKNKHKSNNMATMWTADNFNNHFLKVAESIHQTSNFPPTENYDIPNALQSFCSSRLKASDSFTIPSVTVHEVGHLISNLKNKKSMGPDNLNASVLKLALPYTIETLTYVYNLCIKEHTFPTAFKTAKITPLPKSKDLTNLNNFRPISLLSVVSKPLEKHIHKHLMDFIETHNLFYPFQSGFRRFHSCHTALTRLCDTWLSAINKGQIVGAVFLDFKKAFDLVNHEILLQKLDVYIKNPSVVNFFRSYLTDRRQYVYLNGKFSSVGMVQHGVPQGSILGPILFCLFINDLPMHISTSDASCDLFADDSSLHSSHTDPSVIESSLQKCLNDTSDWCTKNHMALNPDKTKSMIISTRQKHQLHFITLTLKINNASIEQVDEHRVLGVIIDNQFKWQSHISYVCKQVARNLFLLKRLSHYVDTPTRKLFYEAHCLSHINYASTIWSGASDVHIQRLTSLHRRAIKLIQPDDNLTTNQKFYDQKLLPLHKHLLYNKFVFMFKVHTNTAPQYLSTFTQTPTQRYNSSKYILPHVRIDLYRLSFAYFGPVVWNSLPMSIKACKLLSSFKSRVKQFLLEDDT